MAVDVISPIEVVYYWPSMCPCCGRALDATSALELKLTLGSKGTTTYYSANVPHCRRCVDHILQADPGLRFSNSSIADCLLLGKNSAHAIYGWTETCISNEHTRRGLAAPEPPIAPGSQSTYGQEIAIRFVREDYARQFVELNPSSRIKGEPFSTLQRFF